MASIYQRGVGFVPLEQFPIHQHNSSNSRRQLDILSQKVQQLGQEVQQLHLDRRTIINECIALQEQAHRITAEAKKLRLACGGVSGVAVSMTVSLAYKITGIKFIAAAVAGAVSGASVGYIYDKFIGEE